MNNYPQDFIISNLHKNLKTITLNSEYLIKNILWDFDGVLMNSNEVRDRGFRIVLQEFPKNEVDKLMSFHRENGGLSRYVKFSYFFEEIRGEQVSEAEILVLATNFSQIMRKLLIDPKLLIRETLDFVRLNKDKYTMHIVSGSDQEELRYLCKCLDIAPYFKSIHGSPKPKIEWVKEILETNAYEKEQTVLIGDSKNDYDAAKGNDIKFVGYGNAHVVKLGDILWKELIQK